MAALRLMSAIRHTRGHLECHDTIVSAEDRDVDEPGRVHDRDPRGAPPARGSRSIPQGRRGRQTVYRVEKTVPIGSLYEPAS